MLRYANMINDEKLKVQPSEVFERFKICYLAYNFSEGQHTIRYKFMIKVELRKRISIKNIDRCIMQKEMFYEFANCRKTHLLAKNSLNQ